jgi:hypothetical protein
MASLSEVVSSEPAEVDAAPVVSRRHPRLDALPPEVPDEPPAHIMERFRGYLAETMKASKSISCAWLDDGLVAVSTPHFLDLAPLFTFVASRATTSRDRSRRERSSRTRTFSRPSCSSLPFQSRVRRTEVQGVVCDGVEWLALMFTVTSACSRHHRAASNYPKHLFDPTSYPPQEYYEELASAQQRAEEERAAAQSSAVRAAVPFVTAGLQSTAMLPSTTVAGVAAGGGGGAGVFAPSGPTSQPVNLTAALAAAREAAAAAAAAAMGKRQLGATLSQASAGTAPAALEPSGGALGSAAAPPGRRRSKWDAER